MITPEVARAQIDERHRAAAQARRAHSASPGWRRLLTRRTRRS